MKKLLIGCGVLALLFVGALGYVVWDVYPEAREAAETMRATHAMLDQLDSQHPFDPRVSSELDAQRYAAMLDMRVAMVADIEAIGRRFQELIRPEDGDPPGMIATLRQGFLILQQLGEAFPRRLESAGMGPTEFGWMTRATWATLRHLDKQLGSEALEPLRDHYRDLKDAYGDQAEKSTTAVDFDTLIGEFPAAVRETAMAVMEADVDRVERVLAYDGFDPFFMLLPLDAEGRWVERLVLLPDRLVPSPETPETEAVDGDGEPPSR